MNQILDQQFLYNLKDCNIAIDACCLIDSIKYPETVGKFLLELKKKDCGIFTVPGVVFDFSKSLDLAIDADIWVLSSQGEVIKFRRGNAEKFKLSDSPADFDPSKIAANDGFVYLALLDSRKSRVVLFDKKTGGYVKQLSNNDLSRALDLVYIDSKTLVVLIDGKLYRLPI
jgi:hypothetical protein